VELNFTGKAVVVTGAGSGIGRAMAVGFARRGASVLASDINEANLLKLQQELALEKLCVEIQACDVSVEQEVADLFNNSLLKNGVDVLVHSAGLTYFKNFTETTAEEYRTLIETNLSGTYYCLQQTVSKMKEHRIAGSIIVISSINAHRPLPSQAVYTSTKAAIESLCQSLAVEVAPLHIRVNCLAPGAVATNLSKVVMTEESKISAGKGIPLGRVGEPEDMVGTALFLASSLSEYMTGSSLIVDGGLILKR